MSVHIYKSRLQPIMLKFLPIMFLSITQKSHILCSLICLNMPTNFMILIEQTALLEIIGMHVTDCYIRMYHRVIFLLE